MRRFSILSLPRSRHPSSHKDLTGPAYKRGGRKQHENAATKKAPKTYRAKRYSRGNPEDRFRFYLTLLVFGAYSPVRMPSRHPPGGLARRIRLRAFRVSWSSTFGLASHRVCRPGTPPVALLGASRASASGAELDFPAVGGTRLRSPYAGSASNCASPLGHLRLSLALASHHNPSSDPRNLSPPGGFAAALKHDSPSWRSGPLVDSGLDSPVLRTREIQDRNSPASHRIPDRSRDQDIPMLAHPTCRSYFPLRGKVPHRQDT